MPSRKSRILVIEDDVDLAKILVTYLSSRGYFVDFVHDGASALTYASRHSYDAVICDLGLPNMDGIEVIRELKTSERNAQTPILVASGQLDDARIEALNQLRVIKTISKPYAPTQIDAELAKIAQAHNQAKGYAGGVIELFARCSNEIIDFYTGQVATMGKAEIRKEKERLGPIAATIDLYGTVLYGYMNLQCNPLLLRAIGAKAYGPAAPPPEQLTDFAAELCNQIAGRLKTVCSEMGVSVVIGLPYLHNGAEITVPRKLSTPPIHIPFSFSSGAEAHVEFALGEPDDLISSLETKDFPIFVYG